MLATSGLSLCCQRRDFLLRLAGGGLAVAASSFSTSHASSGVKRSGPARSCILVYLLGGPPQLDTFDLKPDAPAEVRGPFRPIATRDPGGARICEHLPRLARMTHRFALVRSV